MLSYKMITNNGDREVNEDSVRHCERGGVHCFILADGLGGHGKGDDASAFVCDDIYNSFMSYNRGYNKDFIGYAIEHAQNGLLQEQIRCHAKFQMKTTVVVLIISGDMAYWGHVGDSRLYMFRKSKYKLRTIDHSVPQMLVLARSIKEKEIRHHPDRNKLLKVMGIEWGRPCYELNEKKLKSHQSFLLCTDGFWELVTEKDMEIFLKKSENVEYWLNSMTQAVINNGQGLDMDNYSAIAVML